jgi:hypothetical protein
MSVEWDEVWKAAVGAAVDAAEAKTPQAKAFLRKTAAAREHRMKLLMAAWADGALDEETLEIELNEERRILRMEFLAIRVLTKKAAQDAANAMLKVIGDALLQGIDLVL